MPNTDETNDLDQWHFERTYNSLFNVAVHNQSSPQDKWRYDPFDSKYPTIDGILSRRREEDVKMPDSAPRHTEHFVLVQLKGTRFNPGKNSWTELKKAFKEKTFKKGSKEKPVSAIEQINLIDRTCRALLIGLSVDVKPKDWRIEAAYIGAPKGVFAKMKEGTRIEPGKMMKALGEILDSIEPRNVQVSGGVPPIASVAISPRLTIFPRGQELFYFNKKQDGTFSVVGKGRILGRNISINWTIPRPIQGLTVHTLSGTPELEAVPVTLPHPPYNAIQNVQKLTSGQEWVPPESLPGHNDLWWVLQIRFSSGEGIVEVEAHA